MKRSPSRRSPPAYPVRRALELAAFTVLLAPGCGLFQKEPLPGVPVQVNPDKVLDVQVPEAGVYEAMLPDGVLVDYQLQVRTTDDGFATWLQHDPAAREVADRAMAEHGYGLQQPAVQAETSAAVERALLASYYGESLAPEPTTIKLVITSYTEAIVGEVAYPEIK